MGLSLGEMSSEHNEGASCGTQPSEETDWVLYQSLSVNLCSKKYLASESSMHWRQMRVPMSVQEWAVFRAEGPGPCGIFAPRGRPKIVDLMDIAPWSTWLLHAESCALVADVETPMHRRLVSSGPFRDVLSRLAQKDKPSAFYCRSWHAGAGKS